MQIDVIRPREDSDWETLQAEWRVLEAQADGSFFQSWTWVGCCVRERFTDPVVLRAAEAGRVVGLALFNRSGHTLLGSVLPTLRLHETGRPADDAVFVEHNGPLLARGWPHLMRPMLAAALPLGRLILSGVGDEVRDAAAAVGRCAVTATRPAPYAHLAGDTAAGWLASRGASTRYQLRRSRRRYEAAGRVVAQRAADVSEGLAFLGELASLHQASWTTRGLPGAFAEPAFVTFHRMLVARGLPRDEVVLLRIATVGVATQTVIGFLYNFRWRDREYSYQSGFNYAAAHAHQAPGLTCHNLAIEAAVADGYGIYDFLAGDARYKRSLGNRETQLHWLEVTGQHALSPRAALARLASPVQRVRNVLRPTRDDRTQQANADGRFAVERLAWPLAAVVILALSCIGWIAAAYLVHEVF